MNRAILKYVDREQWEENEIVGVWDYLPDYLFNNLASIEFTRIVAKEKPLLLEREFDSFAEKQEKENWFTCIALMTPRDRTICAGKALDMEEIIEYSRRFKGREK